MTRIGRRLIEDFLLPALDDEKYGDLLKWIDRENRYFSIRWSHKNAAKWTLEDTAVFQDWDRLKGHYHPEMKGYYMQAKQRFRAALYKLSSVRKVPCEDKHVKKYQLIFDPDKRAEMTRKSIRHHKEANRKSIPTPVICRNTSFIARASSFEELDSLPPSIKIEREDCDKIDEAEMCVEEYQRAFKSQQLKSKRNSPPCCFSPKTLKTSGSDYPVAVLRESPQMNIPRSHVPIQPLPMYNKCAFRQALLENSQKAYQPVDVSQRQQSTDGSQKRVESPHLLLVPTYNDPALATLDNEKELTAISVLCGGIIDNRNSHISDHALNLSVRCDSKEAMCR